MAQFTLKRDAQFEAQLAGAIKDNPRFEKAFAGLAAALECKPEEFPIVFVDYRIRCACIGNWPGIPAADVYYTVHKPSREVRLHWLVFPDIDEDDGFGHQDDD